MEIEGLSKHENNLAKIVLRKLYKEKKYQNIRMIMDDQINDVSTGHSVIKELFKVINYPFTYILENRNGGNALRIIAKKS